MNYAIEGIYKNGNVELMETPEFHKPVGVIVIFPKNKKKIAKLGGLFKDFTIDYDSLEKDLNKLNRCSSQHILDKQRISI